MEEDGGLRRGDRVTVARDFGCDSLIAVKILKGWKGQIVRLDSTGDALVNFVDEGKLLWVARQYFADLVREKREPVADVAPEWPPDVALEEMAIGSMDAAVEGKASAPSLSRTKKNKGYPVWLHVYDLGQVSRVVLNSWAAQSGGPGGAFHCGLEVLGVEFSFQAISSVQEDDETSGVTWHNPKAHPRHVFRESVWLGFTPLTVNEIGVVLERLEQKWLARNYHCLRNNCTDFAERLATEIRAPRPFPQWAHGVAKSQLLSAVAQAPGTSMLGPCCSSWASCSSPMNTERSSFMMNAADDEMDLEGTMAI